MKKIDLGQSITILANLGVLVGILLLVYELHQNSRLTAAQIRHEPSQSIIEQLRDFVVDRELAELALEGFSGSLSSSADQARYGRCLSMRIRYWEDVRYQYRSGLFDEAEYLATRETWRVVLESPSVREYWETRRSTYSPNFVAEIDELIKGSAEGN